MEKVFKILVVFALLMLVIVFSGRAREKKFREYYFEKKTGLSPDGDPDWEVLVSGSAQADRSEVVYREDQLVFRLGEDRTIAVSDEGTGRPLFTIPLEEYPDSLAFDPATGLLYCCSGEGAVTIIRHTGRDGYKVMQRLLVPKGFPIILCDPRTGKIYLCAEEAPGAGGSVLVYTNQ